MSDRASAASVEATPGAGGDLAEPFDAEHPSVVRASFFDAFAPIYERLALLAPTETFALLRAVRDLEMREFEGSRIEAFVTGLLPHLRLAPKLAANYDLHSVAEACATSRAMRLVDDAFLATYATSPRIADIIEFDSLTPILDLVKTGEPPILLPLHVGPVEASFPVMALSGIPLTVVISGNASPASTGAEALFESFGIEVVPADGAALLQCSDALKRGRVVAIAADELHSSAQRLAAVPFMGATVHLPRGFAALARGARRSVLPYMFRSDAPGHFRFDLLQLRPPPSARGGEPALVAEVLADLESVLLAGKPWEWNAWRLFPNERNP